jgi:hypothetical protein
MRGSAIVRELDEILVWVAHVDAADGSGCARPLNGAFLDLHTGRHKDAGYLFDRIVDNEAQIGRSRLRLQRLRLELVTSRMQIDLTRAEGQGMTSILEEDVGHSEHADVEVDGRFEIGDGKNEMVETVDAHTVRLPMTSAPDTRPSSVRHDRAPH